MSDPVNNLMDAVVTLDGKVKQLQRDVNALAGLVGALAVLTLIVAIIAWVRG